VVKHLRCGGENDKHFIANSLLNPRMKKLKKHRPTFDKVISEEYRWSFLTHSVDQFQDWLFIITKL